MVVSVQTLNENMFVSEGFGNTSSKNIVGNVVSVFSRKSHLEESDPLVCYPNLDPPMGGSAWSWINELSYWAGYPLYLGVPAENPWDGLRCSSILHENLLWLSAL